MNNKKGKRSIKILLATDGSKYSKAAIEEIANRPYPPKTEVRIISVVDKDALTRYIGPLGVMSEYHVEVFHSALKRAEKITKNAGEIFHKNNPALTITTTVIDGSPKSVILEEAEKFGANLIIVGSHGYGAVERFLLGSVSQAVALHAKCSVEIVRK